MDRSDDSSRMKDSHRFFRNTGCKFFPCHKNVDEAEFNCLFCYCPLYPLGEGCGGDFVIKDGVKSCINCIRPHIADNYDEINEKLRKQFSIPDNN